MAKKNGGRKGTCTTCKGSGRIRYTVQGHNTGGGRTYECPSCNPKPIHWWEVSKW